MTKLFYTDPLAAAWMSKHFNIKLVYYATQDHADEYGCEVGEEWDWKEGCLPEGSDVQMIGDALAFLEDASPEKIYVHSDSLPIFQPQEGDKDEDGYKYSANTKWWLFSAEDHKGRLQVFNKGSNSKTAMRQGKPFMWPERED